MTILKKKPTVQEKQAPQTPPKDVSPPPSYAADPPDLTAAFSNLSLGRGTAKPTRDQCIAHLKLLECFHELRETIATKNGLFGIRDHFAEQGTSPKEKAELLRMIREKRWSIYVAKAAIRFEAWWLHAIEVDSKMLQVRDLAQMSFEIKRATPINDMEDNLPPIGESNFW